MRVRQWKPAPQQHARVPYGERRIVVDGPLGCHIWLGATTPRGYPVLKVDGRTRLARRVVYERDKRVLQRGERVEMQCGERLCVCAAHMQASGR